MFVQGLVRLPPQRSELAEAGAAGVWLQRYVLYYGTADSLIAGLSSLHNSPAPLPLLSLLLKH